ncbi:MAG: putative manganese transporter [Eubacteriales bacterium]|nr:putative manganese transporter [Eubacteriales bacterium]
MSLDLIMDAVLDTAKLLPFLYLTYLFMEYLEEKAGEKTIHALEKTRGWGPAVGAFTGIIPQCGFSAASASLYAGGVITLGSLLAVFLSTSDEMLPILISQRVHALSILKIMLAKVVLAAVTGFAVDAFLRVYRKYYPKKRHDIHELCDEDDCHCEEGNIFISALIHTAQIAAFILILSVIISFLVELVGEETIAGLLGDRPVVGVLLAGLAGLIPNCAASVMITTLYLRGLLSAGQMMAGLLVGAGVGLLVLFRANRHYWKENLIILAGLYGVGVFWGLVIEVFGIVF